MVEKISSTSISHIKPSPQKNTPAKTTNSNQKDSCESGGCVLELGNKPQKSITYAKPTNIPIQTRSGKATIHSPKPSMVDSGKEKNHLNPFKGYVAEQLNKQATANLVLLQKTLETNQPVDEKTQMAAQKSISEGGEFSVESTAKRLFDFAMVLSGGDTKKLGELKEAITEGFQAIEELMGGQLPEISYKTYDRTMEMIDKAMGQ